MKLVGRLKGARDRREGAGGKGKNRRRRSQDGAGGLRIQDTQKGMLTGFIKAQPHLFSLSIVFPGLTSVSGI